MEGEMKHEEKGAEMGHEMEHGPHHGPMGSGPMHMGPREMQMMKKRGWGWQNNWKSPVSLGFFLLAAALALAIFLYTILNLVGTILEAVHPAASQDGMSAQELQQLEQSAPASDGSTGMPSSGASAQ